ncbi:MAG: phage integrase SAM-like domain-containing protein, partial [Duncaniella sp.]|nr:phage integrase SAM-like domain-containing protein [Duncaniella sp.]
MTETKRHTNREHIDFFQSRLDTLSPETAVKYRRTISELDLFLTHHSLQLADLNPTMTADWACHLLRKGLSKSTVTRHLNILSTLAHSSARQGLTTSTDAPRALARRLADTTLPPLINEHTFKLCLDRLRHTITHTSYVHIHIATQTHISCIHTHTDTHTHTHTQNHTHRDNHILRPKQNKNKRGSH